MKLFHEKINRSCTGFSLTEILIVLILLSMVSLLFFQGLSYSYRLIDRSTNLLSTRQQESLLSLWLSQLFSGIQAKTVLDGGVLQGSQNTLEGTSYHPITQHAGLPALFSLRLEQTEHETHLYYKENHLKEWRIASWPQEKLFFSYTDQEEKEHSIWPPQNHNYALIPLPNKLCLCREGKAPIVLTSIITRLYPYQDLREQLE